MSPYHYSRIAGEVQKWYPLPRMNSVPCCHLVIYNYPPAEQHVLPVALESIPVVTIIRVAESFNSVIHEMTYSPD